MDNTIITQPIIQTPTQFMNDKQTRVPSVLCVLHPPLHPPLLSLSLCVSLHLLPSLSLPLITQDFQEKRSPVSVDTHTHTHTSLYSHQCQTNL